MTNPNTKFCPILTIIAESPILELALGAHGKPNVAFVVDFDVLEGGALDK